MKKLILAISCGITSMIVVILADIFNHFTSLGSFAWITFVIWSFSLALFEKKSKEKNSALWLVLGLPIGMLLAIAMIWIPQLCNGNLIIKYLVVFLANTSALLFSELLTYGIFFGISFTFSGVGVGLFPDNLSHTLSLLLIIIIFSLLGKLCLIIPDKIQLLLTKKNGKNSK